MSITWEKSDDVVFVCCVGSRCCGEFQVGPNCYERNPGSSRTSGTKCVSETRTTATGTRTKLKDRKKITVNYSVLIILRKLVHEIHGIWEAIF